MTTSATSSSRRSASTANDANVTNGSDHRSHAALMNRIYRHTRHVYDVTRRFYLFGRDRLLDRIAAERPARVLEIGCGTGRNLIRLHQRLPDADLYGIDISSEMLATARKSLQRFELHDHIILAESPAESVHYRDTFRMDDPFDAIFFSYSLSMMSTWQSALEQAWDNLNPDDGHLFVVDFCDQQRLPALFRLALQRWLSLFHVKHHPEHIPTLIRLANSAENVGDDENAEIDALFGRYAYIAKVRKHESEINRSNRRT